MKVARFHAPGDIRIEEAPEPSPGPAEVKVRVCLRLPRPPGAGVRTQATTSSLPISIPAHRSMTTSIDASFLCSDDDRSGGVNRKRCCDACT